LPTSSGSDADRTTELAGAVKAAAAEGRALVIRGAGTRAGQGRPVAGDPLDVAAHRGLVDYDPAELVLTARAGTPLAEIEALLEANGQMLAFEPPRFGPGGTLGGAVASGLSGPRRPFTGALRDYVLGVRVLNGRGEVLRFGGTVFKNVAGFDAFRLMAGAHGTLGVLLDVSLRVVPRPAVEAALVLDLPGEEARRRVAELMRHPLPLSGAFHDGQRLYLRLSGGRAGVEAATTRIGGEAADPAGWVGIRDLSHPVLAGGEGLWRIALPRTGPADGFEDLPWDQAGGVRWMRAAAPSPGDWDAAARLGGHIQRLRGTADPAFQPLPPPLLALHQRIKAALDPDRILNPGRMYPEI
jgi:glycolate oxidase FAD binding subunit